MFQALFCEVLPSCIDPADGYRCRTDFKADPNFQGQQRNSNGAYLKHDDKK